MSSIKLANMKFINWLVHSISGKGRGFGKVGGLGYCYFSPKRVSQIWRNIQVIKYPLYLVNFI